MTRRHTRDLRGVGRHLRRRRQCLGLCRTGPRGPGAATRGRQPGQAASGLRMRHGAFRPRPQIRGVRADRRDGFVARDAGSGSAKRHLPASLGSRTKQSRSRQARSLSSCRSCFFNRSGRSASQELSTSSSTSWRRAVFSPSPSTTTPWRTGPTRTDWTSRCSPPTSRSSSTRKVRIFRQKAFAPRFSSCAGHDAADPLRAFANWPPPSRPRLFGDPRT